MQHGRTKTRARLGGFAACVALSLLLASCGAYSATLREWNEEARFEDAREGGARWLARHDDEADTPEWRAVYYEHARADLGAARQADSAAEYAAFQARHRESPLAEELVREARALEAEAEYRDAVKPSRDVARYRRFRADYAGTEAAARAHADEARVAFGAALGGESVTAWRHFREDYVGVPEAAPLLARALRFEAELELHVVSQRNTMEAFGGFIQRYAPHDGVADLVSRAVLGEATLAFELARVTHTREAYERFRDAYGGFPQVALLLADVRTLETGIELDDALAEGTLEALWAFRVAHPEAPWAERAGQAMGALALAPLSRHVRGEGPFTHADADTLLQVLRDLGAEVTAARPDQEVLRRAAERHEQAPLYRAYLALFPDAPAAANASERLRALLWAEAGVAHETAAYSRIARTFPDDPGTAGVAAFLALRNELERAGRRGYSVEVQRALRGRDDTELTFTVRDCAGQPVVGLRESSFRLFDGESTRRMTDFAGMEQDRPLSVVVALDLSGSMAAEHDAVRQSIAQFVETLRLRGREMRVGLLGYADTVVEDTALAANPARFLEAMSRLHADGAGFAEDGVGALARAAQRLGGERGERVAILLSDESLQMNALGASEFGVGGTCGRNFAATNCAMGCQTDQCALQCLNRLGPAAARVLRQCRARLGRFGRLCILEFLAHATAGSASCSSPHAVLAPLTQRLDAAGVRPFFVVSHAQSSPGGFAEYQHLASSLGGGLVPVPNDSTDPAPYRDALLAIAEQLSTQYVARIPHAPGSTARGGAAPPVPTPVVQPAHEWQEAGLATGVVAVAHVGGSPNCPVLAGVRAGGQVARSSGCGQAWADVGVSAAEPTLATLTGERAALVTPAGELVVVSPDAVQRVSIPGVTRFAVPAYDHEGRLWTLGRTAAGSHVLALGPLGEVLLDWALPFEPAAMLALPAGSEPMLCLLGSDGARHCRALHHASWHAQVARGVEPAALASVHSVDVGYPLTLVATLDGRVLRSTDRGGTFTEVLGASAAGPARLAVSPAGDLLCAGVGANVLCSENDGRDWVQVGSPTDPPTPATPFFVGAHLYAVRGARISAAQRVVTRELPGAAALFDTGVDRPRSAAEPLLLAFARAMLRDPQISARIEGHADARGDEQDNEDLAARRAASVADRLVALGVPRSRLVVASFGQRRPARAGSAPADLARNRRVEMIATAPLPAGGWYGSRCAGDM